MGFITKLKLWGSKMADEMLAYETVKTVRVHDRCLGAFRFSVMLALGIWIIINFATVEYLHLKKEVPTATATAKLIGEQNHASQIPDYCGQDGKKCVNWKGGLIRFPQGELNALTVSTSVCPEKSAERFDDTCKYVNGIENWKIQIDHRYQASGYLDETGKAKYSSTGKEMYGELHDEDGKVIKKFTEGEDVVLTIGELLQAAGVKLDEDLRQRGLQLKASFRYEKLHRPFQTSTTKWFLKIRKYNADSNALVQFRQTIFQPDTSSPDVNFETLEGCSKVFMRQSIHIDFEFGGKIGRFDWRTCIDNILLQLVTLGLIVVILDSFLTYFPWTSKNFFNIKYEVADFDVAQHIATRGKCECPRIERPLEREARLKEKREIKKKQLEAKEYGVQPVQTHNYPQHQTHYV